MTLLADRKDGVVCPGARPSRCSKNVLCIMCNYRNCMQIIIQNHQGKMINMCKIKNECVFPILLLPMEYCNAIFNNSINVILKGAAQL